MSSPVSTKPLSPDEVIAHSTYVAEMYDAAYDFDCYEKDRTRMDYMIAATPRSGTTHLSVELWRTGAMGAPLEYLNPPFRKRIQKRLGTNDDIVKYWRAVRNVRTSPNGVFGYKMFISDYIGCARLYPELLPRIAPTKVLVLTRSDIVDQAVSYCKAIQSGAWYSGVKCIRKPIYNSRLIMYCIRALRYQFDFWSELFRLTNTKVCRITYEDLVRDLDGVVRGIAEFLEVELYCNTSIYLPRMRIQRDTESAEWVERFNSENFAKSLKEGPLADTAA